MPHSATMASPHTFHPSILREYDIRGIVGETLSAADAYAIGRAFASFKPEWKTTRPRLAVGCDGRMSSPELSAALIQGLNDSGADVLQLNVGPTPMLYYAVCSQKLDGGIMVTGSHNPPTHNGFKFMLGSKPFYGADIQRIGSIVQSQAFHVGTGKTQALAIEEDYLATLTKAYHGDRKLKVVWDAGNGAAGAIMKALCARLPGEHIPLYAEIDGTFPNHHPDPSEVKNMQALIHVVKSKGCDLGIAFDGDGDRIGAVDETGHIVWGDQLLAFYAREVLAEHPGATIIADVKASQVLFDEVSRLGGKPLMWKTGHSLIKSKMAETGALLAGEMSGHMFFAHRYFGYDDALYAAVRLVALLASGERTLSSLRKDLPHTHSTPEMRIPCAEERKFTVIKEVKERLARAGAHVSDIDGVRVNTPEGWWLLRASNTQAMLVARCESSGPAGLARLKEQLQAELKASGVTFTESHSH